MWSLLLASETVENMSNSESHFVEWALFWVTLALTLVSLLLAWITYLGHRDSVKALSHDNDNMHDLAKNEIDAHRERHMQAVRELKRIQHAKKAR